MSSSSPEGSLEHRALQLFRRVLRVRGHRFPAQAPGSPGHPGLDRRRRAPGPEARRALRRRVVPLLRTGSPRRARRAIRQRPAPRGRGRATTGQPATELLPPHRGDPRAGPAGARPSGRHPRAARGSHRGLPVSGSGASRASVHGAALARPAATDAAVRGRNPAAHQVSCPVNSHDKLRRIFCRRQGAMTSSGRYHARKSNAADGKKDQQVVMRIHRTGH